MTDPGESLDVVDVRDAALISRHTPGRAYCRTDAGVAVAFQSAHVSNSAADDGTPTIRRLPPYATAAPAGQCHPADPAGADSDLSRLVAAIRRAAELLGIPRAASPWPPPLPAVVPLESLPPTAVDHLPLGLADLPTRQCQQTHVFDLAAGGGLLVAGGPGSGRTTLLRTVGAALAGRFTAAEVHIYAFDGAGGGLAALARLPHVGAVVARDEPERGDRVIARLAADVRCRQQAEPDRVHRPPWLMVLVDDWDGFVTVYDGLDHGRPVDSLLRLLREGPAVGLRTVVAGDRSLLAGRLASAVPGRLILPMADPMDYALAGIAWTQVPARPPAGRALVPGDPVVEVQLATLGRTPAEQAARLARLAGSAGPVPRATLPFRVRPLPPVVSYADACPARPTAGPLWTLIGVGGDDAQPVGLDLAAVRSLLVTGPPGSGKTTALRVIARWYAERGVRFGVVAPRRSPLGGLAPDHGCPPGEPPEVVLVDDADALLDTDAEATLMGAGCPIVAAAGSIELATIYRGLTVQLRRSGAGLLLRPGPLDGELFGVQLPRGAPGPPGRGLLASRGELTPVQVAHVGLAGQPMCG